MKSQGFQWTRATMSRGDFGAGVLLRATAGVAILCTASLVASQILVHSHSVFVSLALDVGRIGLSGIGALLGCAGVLACRFLEGRSYMRRWLLYVYALALLVSGFLCVLQWFEVSGATGFWS